jgi:NADH dehydrogenase
MRSSRRAAAGRNARRSPVVAAVEARVTRSRSDRAAPRIVIVGGGFGGAYCAQALERRLRAGEAEILLLDRNNYFVFHPLLVEAGTGSLEPRHAVVSIRAFLKRARFVMGEVVGVDFDTRRLSYLPPGGESPLQLPYDHLVLAPGSVTRLPDVPGLRERGFEMKRLGDAVRLRDPAIRQLERADASGDPRARRRMLHFVVVGGNFTGVEVAGEFRVFLRRASRRYQAVDPDDVRVTLVELGSRILPVLDEGLAAYASDRMRSCGTRIELGLSVARIDAESVTLTNGQTLESETVIWCAGIAPSPLVERLALPRDSRGYLLCERDLRVVGRADVWAIGDSAVNPGPDGAPYPATAQHAVRQATHLAGNLASVLRGRPTRPCDIRSPGELAALGCRTAVARVFGIRLAGFPAWFLWRTVYLLKMPGLARKVRVALDWSMDLIFAKEAVQLGLTSDGGRGRPTRRDRPGPAARPSDA